MSSATGVTATNEVFTLACDAGDGVCLPFLVVVSQLQRDLTGVVASIGVLLPRRHRLIGSFARFLPVASSGVGLQLGINGLDTTP